MRRALETLQFALTNLARHWSDWRQPEVGPESPISRRLAALQQRGPDGVLAERRREGATTFGSPCEPDQEVRQWL